MISIGQAGDGSWAWAMLAPDARHLVYREGYCSEACALKAARGYRAAFFSSAEAIDHRQGACI
jgi:hypothetical protein